jgi:hypothetical protein
MASPSGYFTSVKVAPIMNIRFADDSDLAAVARLNRRLKAGGKDDEMPLDPALPGEAQYRPEGFPVYRRMIIAEDGQEVRAAMLLCRHNVLIHGVWRDFCWTKLPLSEGIIDSRYSLAIVQLIKRALDYQPFMMGVGAGVPESEGHRLFAGLRWRHQSVPFFFYPVKVSKVLRGLNYLKNNVKLRYGALLGAYSGIGAAVSGLLALRRKLSTTLSGYEASVVERFDEWADRIFAHSLSDYPVAIRSDATCLNIVYPPDDHRYIRLRVRRKCTKQDAGWIVVASKQMRGNHYFGDLKVGTLVDGFGGSEDVRALVAAGLGHLVGMGVDIIVANFSHAAWAEACRRSGMFSGPSNFQIFVSPKGGPLLGESCPLHQIHVARGHSDGMDNLI